MLYTKNAKAIINKFMNGLMKCYKNRGLAALHVLEKRIDATIHFHVCLLIFTPDKFPFAPSRFYRDFRTDLFKRWNRLNGGECVHDANRLIKHEFDFDSIEYLCEAIEVTPTPPKRAETNWWGLWNKELLNNSPYKPAPEEVNNCFNQIFKKRQRNRRAQATEINSTTKVISANRGRCSFKEALDRFLLNGANYSPLQPENDKELDDIDF